MQKAKFLVILDAKSAIGALYANGSNDGFASDGTLKHPILDCAEINADLPSYLSATRDMKSQGKSHQSLLIPHGSVVMILRYAEEKPNAVGFQLQMNEE